MKKFVPYEKLSKSEKRKLDNCRRVTWGVTNPVTRKAKNAKAYDRKKFQRIDDYNSHSEISFFI